MMTDASPTPPTAGTVALKFRLYADELLQKAQQAEALMREMDQAAVDAIVTAAFHAAFAARVELAEAACEETGIGIVEDKAQKNVWAALCVYDDIIERKTVGVIHRDLATGITEIAEPRGPILALTPMTNPTSTVIVNVLHALKTRNPIIFSAHRAAKKCSRQTAMLMLDAAVKAGAPEHAVQVITKADKAFVDAVLTHPHLAVILATGTSKIVKTAQDTGKPTLGVGPGNVPCVVHPSADATFAAETILLSKCFDHGTVCASEQALIVPTEIDDKIRAALEAGGARFVPAELTAALGEACFDVENRTMKADVVGRPAGFIAEKIGLAVPDETVLLVATPDGVGPSHPLSHEILAPVVAYYVVPDFTAALDLAQRVIALGGVGHTASLFAEDAAAIDAFAKRLNVGRLLVNQPATHGALGGFTNAMRPSLSLACGARAGNDFLDNLTTDHLLEIRRLCLPQPNVPWSRVADVEWLDTELTAETALARYRGI